ncbi:LOW QUALITY PROTEIN: immunoglobulin superfamily member 1-like [Corvus cornix cornix]|uniref:LOW QUALITY PROTEIN: immunoglobulin superfamily member 1-like n=1 Tax=Corvus cornix cornix TaxID=932674 RepID=UPI0019529E59|nr:LOW QUALITY PROTEIN: immunoglobulin superfamily member 1-like [Corvus cornix cornix]
MLPVTHVIAFGAWLVAQSEATPSAPTISIYQKPPGVIPPGGSTTICCTCQHSYGSFVLYKGSHQLRTLEQSGSRAEFSISNATYEDRGTYVCHYLEGGTVLARSDELEVSVEELRLPRPDLSVLPGHKVTVGADVMLRCTPTHPSTGCYLYLEGQIRAQLLPREQGDYNLSVQKGDGGRYSCQCYAINASREWSAVSRTLDLVVRDYTLCNVVRLALGAGLLLLLGLLTAEAARSRCCRAGGAARSPLRDRRGSARPAPRAGVNKPSLSCPCPGSCPSRCPGPSPYFCPGPGPGCLGGPAGQAGGGTRRGAGPSPSGGGVTAALTAALIPRPRTDRCTDRCTHPPATH